MGARVLSLPSSFRIPDLFETCPFSLSIHKNCDILAEESQDWIYEYRPDFTDRLGGKLYGTKAVALAAYSWPYCNDTRMRVICDFITYLFHLDDISDVMVSKETEPLADIVMNALWFPHFYRPTHAKGKEQPNTEPPAGRMTRNFWTRCIQDAGPGFQARFIESMERYLAVVNVQAKGRADGRIQDVESYIIDRRDNSGLRLVCDLIEYGCGIDLPDFVVNDPLIKILKRDANEYVSWCNDIFSWNFEQSRGDNYNLLFVLMKTQNLDLQAAAEHAGVMCNQAITSFCENRQKIPSWGPDIDEDVASYVQGLQHWMVGSLHWSFVSERYFGKDSAEVKKTRLVKVLPTGQS